MEKIGEKELDGARDLLHQHIKERVLADQVGADGSSEPVFRRAVDPSSLQTYTQMTVSIEYIQKVCHV